MDTVLYEVRRIHWVYLFLIGWVKSYWQKHRW